MDAPLSILVVDHQEAVRASVKASLRDDRYAVITAETGAEALRILLEHDVMVLLVDLELPDIGALELAELVHGRERSARVPIVLMVSTIDRELLERGYRSGVIDYVLKPPVPEVLHAKVELFERLHRQRAQLVRVALLEERLANERRYRHLADAVPNLVWTARRDGSVDYLNQRWSTYTGERHPHGWSDAVHRDDLEACEAAWRHALASGEMFECECRLRRADGADRWFLCRAIPERAAGEVVAWLGTFTDIDHERRTREELAEFKGTLDAVLDAVIMFAAGDARVLYVNQGASALLGYTQPELLAMRPVDFLAEPDEARLREVVAPIVAGDKAIVTFETTFRHRDTRAVPVEVSLQLIRVDGGRIVALARDITAQTRARSEREQAFRETVDALRARDEFLSIASHELRTPLSALQLQVEMLLQPPRRDPTAVPSRDEVKKGLELAARQIDRLARLISEMLDVSRITAGRLRLECEDADLAAIARDVVERFTAEAARTRRTISVDAPDPVTGVWDRLRVDQVVTNLVDNAFKFGAGKPIEVAVVRDGATARLTVTDHGVGISPEDVERIFHRYEQAAPQRTAPGLGLGLYIVRGIVEAHGGTVHVESTLGVGSTFTIELPGKG